MNNDLKDIDPEVVEQVLANADAFIAADTKVDEIVAWGEEELKKREEEILARGGTVDDFKKAAADIEEVVKQKLHALEKSLSGEEAVH
jgi:hypothetical protein